MAVAFLTDSSKAACVSNYLTSPHTFDNTCEDPTAKCMFWGIKEWTDPEKSLADQTAAGTAYNFYNFNNIVFMCLSEEVAAATVKSMGDMAGYIIEDGYPKEFTDEVKADFLTKQTCTATQAGDCFFENYKCYKAVSVE